MNPPLSLQGATLDQLRKTANVATDTSMLEALKAELYDRRVKLNDAIDATVGALDRSTEKRAELQAIIELERQVDTKLNAPTGTPDVPTPQPPLPGKAGEVQGFFDKLTQNPATQGIWGTIKTIGEWIHGTAVWFGEVWKTTIGPTLTYMKNGIKTWLNSMGTGFVTGASSVLGWMGFEKAAQALQQFATGEASPTTNPETPHEKLRKQIEDLFPEGTKVTNATPRDATRFQPLYDRICRIRAKPLGKPSVADSYSQASYIADVIRFIQAKLQYAGQKEFTVAKFMELANEFNDEEDKKTPQAPAGQPAKAEK